MDILTYVLIGVFVLLMLSCFKGMSKQGGSCGSMTGGGKDSCQSKKKDEYASPSQSTDLQKMHAQMEEMEKQNQKLLKEMEALKSSKG